MRMVPDFDKAPDRRGGDSYKWNVGEPGTDIVPLWVADMDFAVAPCITDALRRRVDHGVFGYVSVGDEYYRALDRWFSRRHGYTVERSQVIYTSGVVPAVSATIKALTRPGDGVMVLTPVYNCFFSSIRNNGCVAVESPLHKAELMNGDYRFEIDFEDFERLAADARVRVFLLCNPHNPGGRVWTPAELNRMAEICRRNGVAVISDEIHCELTMPGYVFTSWAKIDGEGVILNSPSKAFNTAGLQIANIICRNPHTLALIDRAININEVCDVNPFGVTALVAAYTEGEPWLEAVKAYIYENYLFTREFVRLHIPGCRFFMLEATYLAWIEVGEGMPPFPHEDEFERNGVKLGRGDAYHGVPDAIRINLACPRKRLEEGLRRMARTLAEAQNR